jgi:flagellar FliL protein
MEVMGDEGDGVNDRITHHLHHPSAAGGYTLQMGTGRAGKTLIILLLGCGLLSMAIGVGVGLFMGKRALASGKHHKAKAKKTLEIGAVHSLGEMVVNLADTGTLRYIKVTVALGFKEKVPEEKLKEYEPVLRDAVIEVFTRKRFSDLHRQGGVPKVKAEILQATASKLHDATVAVVYLESFAMQ